MTFAGRLIRNRRGAAAAEMALVLPILLTILTGSVELGNYFMNEHILAKGVRDGARYAARQSFVNYTSACGADAPQTVIDNTKLIVRKGSLDANAADLLPKWSDSGVVFKVTVECTATADSQNMTGIYRDLGTGAIEVKVDATVPYLSVLSAFGFSGKGFNLTASQTAAVAGI